jgi:cytidine deaminase
MHCKTFTEEELIVATIYAREKAYAPYSKFYVGAVLYCSDMERSEIFEGANVENSSLGLTICAERVAIFNAVLAREAYCAEKLVLVTSCAVPLPPCGACLQVMKEFLSPNLDVVSVSIKKDPVQIMRWTLRDLLPYPSQSLEKK